MKKKTNLLCLGCSRHRKTFRIMRISLFLFVISTLQIIAGNGYSQSKRLTLDLKNVTIKNVLAQIEDKSDFYFLYDNNLIDVHKKVDLAVKNAPIDEVLDKLFGEGKVNATIKGRHIIIKPLDLNVWQTLKVSGTVSDPSGLPLPGVTVIVKGTAHGAVTDANGNYSLVGVASDATLVFSFVGMKAQEIPIAGKTNINVTMAEDAIGIEEVVAVGYGTQKKVNVIGSITSVTNEEISAAPVSLVSNSLAGRLPGAIIQQRNGEPGMDAASILIRGKATLGDNSPLIVVDGIAGRDLNSIEANDIENITVLKDASAGIYGAQAANGVILINTKRGGESSPTFHYDYYFGVSTPTSLPEMADAATYAQMIREVQTYRNYDETNMTYSLEDIDKYRSGGYPWTHPNTNWFDASLKKYSNTHHHYFSVDGGTGKINYYVSFGKQYTDGNYKDSGTSYDRYNLRSNIDFQINKYFSIAFDMHGSQENRMYSVFNAGVVYNSLVRGRPTQHAVFPNGYLAPPIPDGTTSGITGTLNAGFRDYKYYRSQNNLSATLKIPGIEGLKLSGNMAYDMFFSVNKSFKKPWTVYNMDEPSYLAAGNTGTEDGSEYLIASSVGASEPELTDSYNDTKSITYNVKLSYDKTINDHQINAFIAYERYDNLSKGISAYRKSFATDVLPYLFAGGVEEQSIGSSVSTDARENFFGRLCYNYQEKYLFQFSFRRDGSVRFSEDHGRWGNFPSVLVGWRISNEKFWQDNVPFVNYLKLRASWGQMGNDKVDAFQYLSTYSFGNGMVFGSDQSYQAGISQSSTPNPLITWEVANVSNVGFESMMFDNKVSFNFEYFYEKRSDILIERNASVPSFTGISLPDENFGIVENSGFEAILGYSNKIGGFNYSINGNFAFARNRIVEFDEPERNVPWQVFTDHPQGAALLYKSIGVFGNEADIESYPHVSGARPGDIIIEDYDGDLEITNDDMIIFDKTVDPEITYGISFTLGYRNWNLSGLVQGVGNCMRNLSSSLQGTAGNYLQYDADGRWTESNTTADKPRAWERDEEYWRSNYTTDYYYHNGSYARMKNLQLSYKIPRKIRQLAWLKNAEVYVSGQNLFLIYSGNKIFDPELSGNYNYPLMKVYSVGVNVSF